MTHTWKTEGWTHTSMQSNTLLSYILLVTPSLPLPVLLTYILQHPGYITSRGCWSPQAAQGQHPLLSPSLSLSNTHTHTQNHYSLRTRQLSLASTHCRKLKIHRCALTTGGLLKTTGYITSCCPPQQYTFLHTKDISSINFQSGWAKSRMSLNLW